MANDIQWRDIYLNDEKTDYQIANDGQVKNTSSGIIRKPHLTDNGYLHIVLYHRREPYSFLIHQLVANYFLINDDPEHKTQIDHIDGNKQNNHYLNLEWVTPKENKRRSIELGLCNPHHGHQPRGSKSGVSKYTEKDAHSVCKLLESGLSNKKISDSLNVSSEFVRSIKRKQAWVHISENYRLPETEKRMYYPKEVRDTIKRLIDDGKSNYDIAVSVGLADPNGYGRSYVSTIRRRYVR